MSGRTNGSSHRWLFGDGSQFLADEEFLPLINAKRAANQGT